MRSVWVTVIQYANTLIPVSGTMHIRVLPKLELAEPAAAVDALVLLDGDALDGATDDRAPARSRQIDARMRLNELGHVGVLDAFGYDLVGRPGPSHQPIFLVVGWAECGARRIQGAEARVGPKIGTNRAAAEAAMDRLEQAVLIRPA